MWFNDECDIACNSTQCLFDFDYCIDSEINTNATCSYLESNQTGEISDVCYKSWSDDTWCDFNCNVSSCNFDNNECDYQYCGGRCEQAYQIVIGYLASLYEPYELIDPSEICYDYETLLQVAPNISYGYNNCTDTFKGHDLNNNGYIGFYEGIIATKEYWGFSGQTYENSNQKLDQIDCSQCMQNASLWFW